MKKLRQSTASVSLPKTAKLFFVFMLLYTSFTYSQTTYDWLNTSPDGNWKQGAAGARWNAGGLFDQPSAGAINLRFNNDTFTTMTNNVPGTYNIYGINFAGSATVSRTISGNNIRLFDASGVDPKIQNDGIPTHTINLNMEADGDVADPLELNPINGDLVLNGTLNLYSSDINVYGENSKRLTLSGIVSGTGKLLVKQNSIVILNAIHTYTGDTEIDKGEVWINTSGNAIANNNIFVGNGGSIANVAKLFLSRTAGGTTFTRNFTINPGDASTRFIGSLNTSGINTFSGIIINNATNGLQIQVVDAGGTLRCSNRITGSRSISKIGNGILEFSGIAKTYTGATIVTSGTLRLGAANQIDNASNLQLNGGVFSSGTTFGFSETMGTVALTENSTLNLGTGSHTLNFANSSAVAWTAGKTLTITGWNGSCNGQIFVGTTSGGLTPTQLAQITFQGYPAGAVLTSSGELLPFATVNTASVSIAAVPTGAICAGTSVTFTATPTNGGTTPVYQWKIGTTNVGTNSPTFTSTTLLNTNLVTVVMTSNLNACLAAAPFDSAGITIAVNPSPTITASTTTNPTTCNGTDGSIAFTATNIPNGVYSLSYTGPGSPKNVTVASNAFSLTELNAGNYANFALSSGGCTATAITTKALTNPDLPTITLSTVSQICADATSFPIVYTATSGSPTTYSLSGTGFATITNASLTASPLLIPYTGGGIISYTLTVKNASGCTSVSYTGASTVVSTSCSCVPVLTCPSNIVLSSCSPTAVFATPTAVNTCAISTCMPSSLSTILSNFTTNGNAIVSTIPNRFNFNLDGPGGATASYIADGLSDMYDDPGNVLNTNLQTSIPYTNSVITPSASFGIGGQYFTAKVNNLFVLAADINNLSSFSISGNTGADGSGTASGFTSTITVGCQSYDIFVKRISGAGDPSINHIFILPAGNGATRTFSTNTNDDIDSLNGINSIKRLYYLLVAGTNGYQYTNAELTSVATVFLTQTAASVSNTITPPNAVVTQTAGLPSGSSFPVGVNIVTFQAAGVFTTSSCSFTVTVNAAPTITASTTTNPTTCNGTDGNIAFTSTNIPNGVYSLSYSGVGSPKSVTVTSNAFSLTGINAGNYSNFSVISAGCTATNYITKTLTNSALPTLTLGAASQICADATSFNIDYSGTTGLPTTYSLSGTGFAAIINASLTASPLVIPYIGGGTITYSLTIQNASGCTSVTYTGSTAVASLPVMDIVSNQVICNANNTTAVSFTGTPVGTIFKWTSSNPAIGLAASGTGNIASFATINTTNAPISSTITVTPSIYLNSLAGWSQVRKIDVTENSGATLVDYQLKLIINTQALITAGQLTSTGSDLRFGNSAGTILYNYWIESGINTSNTIVWVKLDNIPSLGLKTIYMFYGNAAATPVSAVNGTFQGPNSSTNSIATGGVGGASNSQRGFRFAPNQDVLVTDFGKREPDGTTRYVTLFNFATQAIIYQTQVAGPAAQYSYANIGNPIWLAQSTDYVLQLYSGATDRYYFGSSSQISSHLTYKDMRYCNNCTQNTFPTIGLNNFHYGYPDLQYYTKQNINPAPTYILFTGAESCSGAPISFNYTVNPTPTVIVNSASATTCSGSALTPIVITGAVAGTVYNWTRDNTATVTGIASSGIGNISGILTNTTNLLATVTFTITPTYSNGVTTCIGTPITTTVNVSTSTMYDNLGNWTNGLPDVTKSIIFDKDFTINTTIAACSCSVASGVTLIVNPDASLVLKNEITSLGTTIFENGSSLVQTDGIVNNNTGNIIYKRNSVVKQQDYVYWSSPVVGFSSTMVFPGTPAANTLSWLPTAINNNASLGDWTGISESMIPAKGYAIRVSNSPSAITPTTITTTFVGVPQNGNYSYAITRGNITGPDIRLPNGATMTANDDNWNLLGNPYPSAIDADAFLIVNPDIQGSIDLWTHGTAPSTTAAQPFYGSYANNYSANDYITYNSFASQAGPNTFNGKIAAGQAFFVKMIDGLTAQTGSVLFTNALRNATFDNGQFYRNTANTLVADAPDKHRIWLDLSSVASEPISRIVVGYAQNATDQYDRLFDATSDYQGSQSFFSMIENGIYSIQAKATPFTNTDIIPLGFSVSAAGNYKIGIHAADGLFANNEQTVYLQDNLLGTIHNLSALPYSFAAASGGNNNRFVLRYTDVVLGLNTSILNDSDIIVYKNSNNLKVQSSNISLKEVQIFDIRGRLIAVNKNIDNHKTIFENLLVAEQVLIVKIKTVDDQILTRKVIF